MLCLAGGLNAEDIASEYCNTLVDPVATDGGGASDDASDSFYMNWHTGDDGAVTITLLTTPGNAATTFRVPGMNIANFTVDGASGKLAHAINDEKTVITLDFQDDKSYMTGTWNTRWAMKLRSTTCTPPCTSSSPTGPPAPPPTR